MADLPKRYERYIILHVFLCSYVYTGGVSCYFSLRDKIDGNQVKCILISKNGWRLKC